MGCCKGYTATCTICGLHGCDKCQVTNHTTNGSYCNTCYDHVRIKDHMDEMKRYIKYLKTILDEHDIYYDGFPVK